MIPFGALARTERRQAGTNRSLAWRSRSLPAMLETPSHGELLEEGEREGEGGAHGCGLQPGCSGNAAVEKAVRGTDGSIAWLGLPVGVITDAGVMP